LRRDRLSRLAESIDALVEKDDLLLERARVISALRRNAAAELYGTCAGFIATLNGLLSKSRIALDPPEYAPENFRDDAPNLFQINIHGRILQIEFRATGELFQTEDFRVPYTLEGAVRSFNQQLLDQDLIREHALFYCLEKDRSFWRYFDERTYRSGPFDMDYLATLVEELL